MKCSWHIDDGQPLAQGCMGVKLGDRAWFGLALLLWSAHVQIVSIHLLQALICSRICSHETLDWAASRLGMVT